MSYATVSFVFGEQPSAAKWNTLGTNDASFNDGTGIANLAWNTTALSNPYKFRSYRNAAANTGNGAFAVVAMDTEEYDTNNNHVSGVYTAPVAGFYHFSGGVNFTTSGAETGIVSLFKNGSENIRGNAIPSTSAAIQYLVGGDIQLAASDTVDLRAICTAARALAVGFTYTNYFMGHLISRT